VKVTGHIASAEGFTEQAQVLNGASDLYFQVFGESGRHARAALGAYELPLGAPVEIELVAESIIVAIVECLGAGVEFLRDLPANRYAGHDGGTS